MCTIRDGGALSAYARQTSAQTHRTGARLQGMEEGKPQGGVGRGLFGSAEATVIAAIFTVAGAVSGALIKGYYDGRTSENAEQLRAESALAIEDRKATAGISLEQQKFQAELILKAIDTEDQAGAVKTLKFFANAGLIPSYEKKVLDLVEAEQGAAIPALRAPSEFQSVSEYNEQQDISSLSRSVALLEVRGYTCSAVLVQALGLIFPQYCLKSSRPEDMTAVFDFVSPDARQAGVVARIKSVESVGERLAIAQLEDGTLQQARGVPLGSRAPALGEAVFIISHPVEFGSSQRVSADCYVLPVGPDPIIKGEDVFSYACRTGGGSGGGPVFAKSDGVLLGIHLSKDRTDEYKKYGVLTAGLSSPE